jgi:chromosome segregation ATPase
MNLPDVSGSAVPRCRWRYPEAVSRTMHGVFIVLLVVVLAETRILAQTPGQVEAEARTTQLRGEFAKRWQSFVLTLKNLPAEERIQRIDEWRASQKKTADSLEAAEKEAARLRQPMIAAISAAPPASPSADPLKADIDATNSEIAAAVRELQSESLTTEDKIKAIDDFLKLNSAAIAQRDANQRELTRRAMTLFKETYQAQKANQPKSPQVTRIEELNLRLREILDSTLTLTPEERIAAIDAHRGEIRKIESDIRQLQKSRQPASLP